MNTREAFLHELQSHLGESERPPGSNETIFNRFMGVGAGPWCMDFVGTCLWAVGNRDLVGIQNPRGPSYVPYTYEWAHRTGRIVSFEQAEPGDGVVFVWGGHGSNAEGDHIGVLVSKSPLVTIEGNTHRHGETPQNDRVMIRHDRSLPEIKGFVRWTLGHGGRPHPPHPPWPGRILSLRSPLMHGEDVRTWQAQMARRKWKIGVDGGYGAESARVCEAFQREKRLVADGQVGPTTWRASWAVAATNGKVPHPAPAKIATGVDRAGAPSLEEALAIRRQTGASWWGVYIGGPCSGGSGWSRDVVRHLGAAGFEFLPIYVGQNDVPHSHARSFTHEQGQHDGREAVRLMSEYGWKPHHAVPVCLDVESITFERQPDGTRRYVAGWVSTVRAAGFDPVVYSSPSCLAALHELPEQERPQGVWIASWLQRGRVDPRLRPENAPHMPAEAWHNGRRAWQYEGDTPVPGGRSKVDVSCATMTLAPAPA